MDFEAMFRQIIREELSAFRSDLKEEIRKETQSDLPPVLNMRQVAKIMQIGATKAYELAKRPDFPVIADGKRRVVLTSALFDWMNQVSYEKGVQI